MRSTVVLALLVIVALVPLLTKGAQGQEFGIPEREAVASMAGQILKLVHVAPGAAPGLHHKRNSEIINSLLGISKLMNEAGRR
ncbi:pigment-dispersing hormone 2 peptides-like [Eriocheir sinensis]|uniref:pigment-dispersing hormone 2 peptides-like n=1 Tax=Eriocheir sinensis TaxID=95602 RepID=UPI0021C923D2|nr:pigment-dispersing hormone 2 peptides-like [Eriocheir sinensis]XP_050708882.1 pigment-dispersing hormone 2 peptides-like [Eriocheir sinensis]